MLVVRFVDECRHAGACACADAGPRHRRRITHTIQLGSLYALAIMAAGTLIFGILERRKERNRQGGEEKQARDGR